MLHIRLITAFLLSALLIYCVSFATQPWITQLLFMTSIVLSGTEFIALRWHTIGGHSHTEFPRPPLKKEHFLVGLAYAMVLPADFFGRASILSEAEGSLPAVLAWITVCTVGGSAFLYRREMNLDNATQKLMNALAGFLYIAIPGLLMYRLSEMSIPEAPRGSALYFSLAIVLMGDSGAYFSGRLFGKTPLIPKVSPKKTVEGAMGGLGFSALSAVVLASWFNFPFGILTSAFVGLIAGCAGQIGDLAESAIKRSANCKDSGNLLPGHGGVLDRVDALLFGVPITYLACLLLIG